MSAGEERPGVAMAAEVAEQPAVWRGLLDAREPIERAGAGLAARRPRFVSLVARGTSDHAALYAKYLVEVLLGCPRDWPRPP